MRYDVFDAPARNFQRLNAQGLIVSGNEYAGDATVRAAEEIEEEEEEEEEEDSE